MPNRVQSLPIRFTPKATYLSGASILRSKARRPGGDGEIAPVIPPTTQEMRFSASGAVEPVEIKVHKIT